MRYIPHTEEDVHHLLRAIGVPSVDALFEAIPEALRVTEALDLPEPLTELELKRHLVGVAAQNQDALRALSFLGAGVYLHHVPAAIDEVLRRAEFYTAYTPYQAEVSQGTLQAVYEFQTMICQLLGMDIANASLYDGSTAVAEAMLMARRVKRKPRIVVGKWSDVGAVEKTLTDLGLTATTEQLQTILDQCQRAGIAVHRPLEDDEVMAIARELGARPSGL